MRALALIVALAAAAAGAFMLARGGQGGTEAFAGAFYLALIGVGVAAFAFRDRAPSEGPLRLVMYALIWLGAIAAVMGLIELFS